MFVITENVYTELHYIKHQFKAKQKFKHNFFVMQKLLLNSCLHMALL